MRGGVVCGLRSSAVMSLTLVYPKISSNCLLSMRYSETKMARHSSTVVDKPPNTLFHVWSGR